MPPHDRMRGYDRDLIRGGHYGQRSCEPRLKAEHMAAATKPCDVKILLANPEPSRTGLTQERKRTWEPRWQVEQQHRSIRQAEARQNCSRVGSDNGMLSEVICAIRAVAESHRYRMALRFCFDKPINLLALALAPLPPPSRGVGLGVAARLRVASQAGW